MIVSRRSTIALLSITSAVLAGCGGGSPRLSSGSGIPTLAKCVSDWDATSSLEARGALDVPAAQESPDVTVATYMGPAVEVSRVGSLVSPGRAKLLVRPGSCIVIAGTTVIIRPTTGAWGLSEAAVGGDFSGIASSQKWSEEHANAVASIGPMNENVPGGHIGLLAAKEGGEIVAITQEQVSGEPATTESTPSTATETTPTTSTPERSTEASSATTPSSTTSSAAVPHPPGITGTACSGRFEDDGDPTSGRGSWADVIASGLSCAAAEAAVHAYLKQRYTTNGKAPSAFAGGLKCHTGEFRPPGDSDEPLGYVTCAGSGKSVTFEFTED
jgi:hypothetical protein